MITLPPSTPTPDPATPVALLKVYDATEFESVYALVELTPAFCQMALGKMALAAQMKAQDPTFDELRWWEYTPTWFKRPDCSDGDDEARWESYEQAEALLEKADSDAEPVVLPPGTFPPYLTQALADRDSEIDARIDCCRLCVDGESLYWYALIKNTDVALTTTYIGKEVLQRFTTAASRQRAILAQDWVDEHGMAVDLEAYLDEPENPFVHQSGPNGCPNTCPACGWEQLTADQHPEETQHL